MLKSRPCSKPNWNIRKFAQLKLGPKKACPFSFIRIKLIIATIGTNRLKMREKVLLLKKGVTRVTRIVPEV